MLAQPRPGTEEQQLHAAGLDAERIGHFRVREAQGVGQPQQVAVARLEGVKRPGDITARGESILRVIGRHKRLVRAVFGQRHLARRPAMPVAHQVGRDPEQVIAPVPVVFKRDTRAQEPVVS